MAASTSLTGKCLYLVSSSARREYVSDCVESLALPSGMVLHFRYLLKYIDDRLTQLLPNRPNSLSPALEGLPVVVVYVYQTGTGGHWRPEEEVNTMGPYLPLRCGRLIEAFRDGKIAHFYFQVTDYIKPEQRRVSARTLLNREVKFRPAPKKKAGTSYAHISRDLRLADGRTQGTLAFQEFVDDAYEPSEWRTRSSGSAPLDVTYDIVFVRVAGLFRERRNELVRLKPVLRGPFENPVAEFELNSGETYHIKIATHLRGRVPTELPGQGNAKLRLQFDPALIRPENQTSFRLSSNYDLHYWTIVTDAQKTQRTVLNIICEDESGDKQDSFVRRELLCPDISLPISVVS